jgi:hypothetical protein
VNLQKVVPHRRQRFDRVGPVVQKEDQKVEISRKRNGLGLNTSRSRMVVMKAVSSNKKVDSSK